MAMNSALLTTAIGMMGVIAGTLAGSYFNHRFAQKNAKKDILFKRKLEYFETMADKIEKNRRMYRNAINELKLMRDNKRIQKILATLKKERKTFLISSSPLYFNNEIMGKKIRHFVKIEKEIFERISKIKNNAEREHEISFLEEDLKKLIFYEELIIKSMKNELRKDL